MKKRLKQMQLQTLDKHLGETYVCQRPSKGWIRSIRSTLGMSVSQLAKRMGVTQQGLSQLEAKEADDAVTIKTLRKAAEALDCVVVYALIPNDGSLQKMVKKQAFNKAKDLIESVDHTMMLEAQSVGDKEDKILHLADELAQNLNSKLWD